MISKAEEPEHHQVFCVSLEEEEKDIDVKYEEQESQKEEDELKMGDDCGSFVHKHSSIQSIQNSI